MTRPNRSQKTDINKESLRLEYCFDKGINFKDRIIQVTGSIEEAQSFDWMDAALSEMERESSTPITIKINSPGGSVYEALAMVDRINDSKCDIITKCYGHAMSAASLILAAGNTRLMGSRSWLMHHQITGGVAGSLNTVVSYAAQMEREMLEWCRIMESFSNKPLKFWKAQAAKRDFYLTAEQCLEYGVIDGIF